MCLRYTRSIGWDHTQTDISHRTSPNAHTINTERYKAILSVVRVCVLLLPKVPETFMKFAGGQKMVLFRASKVSQSPYRHT
jgi:hypothetical protein